MCAGRLVAAWPLLETATIGQSDQHQHHPPPPGIFTPSLAWLLASQLTQCSSCLRLLQANLFSALNISNISLHHLDSLTPRHFQSTSQFYSQITKREHFLLEGLIIVLKLISSSKSQRDMMIKFVCLSSQQYYLEFPCYLDINNSTNIHFTAHTILLDRNIYW